MPITILGKNFKYDYLFLNKNKIQIGRYLIIFSGCLLADYTV